MFDEATIKVIEGVIVWIGLPAIIVSVFNSIYQWSKIFQAKDATIQTLGQQIILLEKQNMILESQKVEVVIRSKKALREEVSYLTDDNEKLKAEIKELKEKAERANNSELIQASEKLEKRANLTKEHLNVITATTSIDIGLLEKQWDIIRSHSDPQSIEKLYAETLKEFGGRIVNEQGVTLAIMNLNPDGLNLEKSHDADKDNFDQKLNDSE